MFSVSTEMTSSLPAESATAGIVNVLDSDVSSRLANGCADVGVLADPRYVPFSRTANDPNGPVSAVSATLVSFPAAVKWPRYHTNPWSKP
jgi:hypothetical protein